jgi:FlaA1/EpsC-like NDP-sugar epimerase
MKKALFSLRGILALGHDLIAVIFAWYAAFLLRFNFFIPSEHKDLMINTIPIVFVISLLAFISFGLYRGTWRFASLMDLRRILVAVSTSSVITAAILFMIANDLRVPRSVLVLYPILIILIMGGSRIIYRALKEHQLYSANFLQGEPVIIFGARGTAISLIKELLQSKEWRVVGILDNDTSIHGREISGVKVHGGIEFLPIIKERFNLRRVIIAMPSYTSKEKRSIINLATKLDIEVLTVPSVNDLMSGKMSVSQIRKIDVEDLLGRDVVDLDDSGLKDFVANKTVMVSGAGGSIGSELCRQILKFKPSLLICFDVSEYALYELEQNILLLQYQINILYIVGDVRNDIRLNELFSQYQPNIVFHAAAYKHVPLMERHNVTEALSNNTLGTYKLAKACQYWGVDKFVFVSTDKAVNPTNVMGASKRLAEIVCQGLQDKKGTKFIIVRFGNVLGSSGSVIPKFRQQIADGGPITVTHPEITRYFMSIPEAAQLVMQAGLMGSGGEIFLLDMGDPVKVVDLAKDMIKLSGFEENDISIEFTGLRPGEKLYEELLANEEQSTSTSHPKLRVAKLKRLRSKNLLKDLLTWIKSISNTDEKTIKKDLAQWIPEYTPDFKVD